MILDIEEVSMSRNKNQTPHARDIALRIAEVLARTDEPRPSSDVKFDPAEDLVLGEVPPHLRHMYNLLEDLQEEASEAKRQFDAAKKRLHTAREVFFDALEIHVPSDKDDYAVIKICEDWQVVGLKHDEDRGLEGIGDVLAKAMASAAMSD